MCIILYQDFRKFETKLQIRIGLNKAVNEQMWD